jgi:hypothetical protein
MGALASYWNQVPLTAYSYAGTVFGRTKTQQVDPAIEPAVVKVGGKGRPTPSRKAAEARNRHPLGSGPVARPGASKEERKAVRAAQREVMNAERARSREAMLTGDERYLPARDKGPARRFARDYVDARRSLGEYFLPFAVVVLILSIVPIPSLRLLSIVLLYSVVLAVGVDAYLLRRRVTKLTAAKFADKAGGAGGYAMMRSLQMRRTRMPRPQVQRGQFPE